MAGVAVVGHGTVGEASAAQLTPGNGGSASGSPCVLSANAVTASYGLDGALARRDITDGKPGVPLSLELTVRCVPEDWQLTAGAAVEIWHCDAWGYYAGYPDAAPGGVVPVGGDGSGADPVNYLRGFQVSDAEGRVSFTTVVPGWYGARAPHIHVRVHSGATREDGGYDGGTLSHSGQLFFDDALIQEAHAGSPYTEHTGDGPATLAEDLVYQGAGVAAGLLVMEPVTASRVLQHGYRGSLTLGITTGAAPNPPADVPADEPAKC